MTTVASRKNFGVLSDNGALAGLLVLVVALIAFQSNAISPQLQVGGVLMALITTIMTGPLIDRFLP